MIEIVMHDGITIKYFVVYILMFAIHKDDKFKSLNVKKLYVDEIVITETTIETIDIVTSAGAIPLSGVTYVSNSDYALPMTVTLADGIQDQYKQIVLKKPSNDVIVSATFTSFRLNYKSPELTLLYTDDRWTVIRGMSAYLNETIFKLTDAVANDYFGGGCISADNKTLFIGAQGRAGGGAVYVYTRSQNTWVNSQTLTASDAENTDYFGNNLCININMDTIVIGAPYEDGVGGSNRGAAYVFTQNGGVWTEQQKLTASDTANNDYFGYNASISADGNTVLVGAFGEDGAGTDRGAAYVFTRSGGVWTEQQKLTASDTANNDFFGRSVSISADGNTAVIGAYNEAGAGTGRGATYIFTRSGGVWAEQQKLTASDTANIDYFGQNVSISADGNTAVIGAPGKDNAGTDRGTVYLFTRSGGLWTERQKLTASDPANTDNFGNMVSISADGNKIAIGASGKEGSGTNRGATYFFIKSDGVWFEQQKLTSSDAADNDYFGSHVTISADSTCILVGAIEKDGAKGEAYIYT